MQTRTPTPSVGVWTLMFTGGGITRTWSCVGSMAEGTGSAFLQWGSCLQCVAGYTSPRSSHAGLWWCRELFRNVMWLSDMRSPGFGIQKAGWGRASMGKGGRWYGSGWRSVGADVLGLRAYILSSLFIFSRLNVYHFAIISPSYNDRAVFEELF